MHDIHEYPFWEVQISDPFWDQWSEINLNALYYQWEQLENTRCIDNFRIAAGTRKGFREGWFFSDSDAYKWLDAAARYHQLHPHKKLLYLMDNFTQLIKKVQMHDGYINTYNQIFFPGKRWVNLWIEHELYCLGHLIEAIISLYHAFQDASILQIALKAADLIIQDFMDKDGNFVPGHQEIEIALLKLHQITQNENYLKMAEQFLTRRGNVSGVFFKYLKQNRSMMKRNKFVKSQKKKYIEEHPDYTDVSLPAHVKSDNPPFIFLRWFCNTGSGKGHQQHALLQDQWTPEGHAVRYTYTQTAIVQLHRLRLHHELLNASLKSWEYMTERRTFSTGGLGSIPVVEGWGRDYELNGEYAYCETCAAIGSLLWNWQLNLATQNAIYADFFEWQLYNAVLVGMGEKGISYLYRNPLISKGVVQRQPWYQVPCCPSNISRIFAELGGKILFTDHASIFLNQYIGASMDTTKGKLSMKSSFPWKGNVSIRLEPLSEFVLKLRIPGWVNNPEIFYNAKPIGISERPEIPIMSASGYSPIKSYYLDLSQHWTAGDILSIHFPMDVKILRYHKKVKNYRQRGTLTRGPLVYCLEEIDNPDIDIFSCNIDQTQRFTVGNQIKSHKDIITISGTTENGQEFIAIPYFFWGNRGNSKMNAVLNFK